MKKKVFTRLKTKVASLGFNREELMSIAAGIADKLDSDEATDEEIDAEIEAALPILKVGQQYATRLSKKPSTTKTGDEEDDEEDDEDETPATAKQSKKKPKKNDDEPEWFKSFREQQETRMSKLEGEKVTTSRKAKLETLLKDSGSFGQRTLKGFARMKFDSDEEFEEFFEEVEGDLEAYNQERADAGLATVSKPLGKGEEKKGGKPKEMTDAEIDALVDQIH